MCVTVLQLIGEAYDLMKNALGMNHDEMTSVSAHDTQSTLHHVLCPSLSSCFSGFQRVE